MTTFNAETAEIAEQILFAPSDPVITFNAETAEFAEQVLFPPSEPCRLCGFREFRVDRRR
jgi:hypothetical protein